MSSTDLQEWNGDNELELEELLDEQELIEDVDDEGIDELSDDE